MMRDRICHLVERVNSLGSGTSEHRVSWIGPASEDAIATVERALGIRLSPGFREFMRQTGGGGLDGLWISGIDVGTPLDEGAGSLYGDTMFYRNEFGLPPHLLVVQRDQDDNEPFCLDTSSPTVEHPVVLYYFNSGSTEKIADTFLDFYERYLEPYLSSGGTPKPR